MKIYRINKKIKKACTSYICQNQGTPETAYNEIIDVTSLIKGLTNIIPDQKNYGFTLKNHQYEFPIELNLTSGKHGLSKPEQRTQTLIKFIKNKLNSNAN